MPANEIQQRLFLDNPQIYFSILLTIKQRIPEIADVMMRPSELKDFLDSHSHLYSEDMVSHISSRYADIICYLETQALIEAIATDNEYDYEYVDTGSILSCMDQILREAVLLDRFPSDLNVHWAVSISDKILSAGIIDISDNDDSLNSDDPRAHFTNSHYN